MTGKTCCGMFGSVGTLAEYGGLTGEEEGAGPGLTEFEAAGDGWFPEAGAAVAPLTCGSKTG